MLRRPPTGGFRDYGTGTWYGGDAACGHRKTVDTAKAVATSTLDGGKKTTGHLQEGYKSTCQRCGANRIDSQIGLEATPEAFCDALVAVFREVRRVLKDDGTCWVNLGDSYLAQQGLGFNGQKRLDHANRNVKVKRPDGVKPKDLVGIPWMVAFALRADGWYLRSDIIWAKPNPMPESVTDRPTKAHEYIFLLSKRGSYYYDADAIAEQRAALQGSTYAQPDKAAREGQTRNGTGLSTLRNRSDDERNARTVWTITTQPYPDAHFATFPEAIPERCIKAGSRIGDLVLDPFAGSGTTGRVAIRLGRGFVGVELNPAYAALARTRIGGAAPLFATETA